MQEDPDICAHDKQENSSYADRASRPYDDSINTSIYIFADSTLPEVERSRNTAVQIARCQLRLHDLQLPLAKRDLIFLEAGAPDSDSAARDVRRHMLVAIAKGAIDVVMVDTIGQLGAKPEDQVVFCAECYASAVEVFTASQGKVRLAIAAPDEVARCGIGHQDDGPGPSDADPAFERHHHFPAPFGYVRDPAAPGQLTIDMMTSRVLVRVVNAFIEGVPPQTIAGQLRDECIPAPSSTTWTAIAVVKLLRAVARNPIYSRGLVMQSAAVHGFGTRLGRRTSRVRDFRLAIIHPSLIQLLSRKLASERASRLRSFCGCPGYGPPVSDCSGRRRWSRDRFQSDGLRSGYGSSRFRL
ncbi:MAG: hypothetical protein K2X54_20000 [Methylobacterium organophilum]|jgi:hypothetical protein|nr:hypothetical protein [Methylobacterium organophilum]